MRQLLSFGTEETDRQGDSVCYRLLREDDDLRAITKMLHAAYRPLAAAGMRYTASYQDVGTTESRVRRGDTIVAVVGERVVGIITVRGPGGRPGPSHYAKEGVASFGQFAVDPEFQRRGIGSRLLTLVEEIAREQGATELALDTAEHAHHLLRLYASRQFRAVGSVQWEGKEYLSLILSKNLSSRVAEGADASAEGVRVDPDDGDHGV